VLVQEDPGNTPYIARTWLVDPAARSATEILQSDPARFAPPNLPPFNVDEESSGIIEVTDIVRSAHWFEAGRRYFLADLQAHYSIPGELVEGGHTVAPLECGEPAEVSRGLRRNLQERDPAVTRRSSGLGHNGVSTILQGDSMWRIRSTRLGILIGVTVVTAVVTVMADPSGKSALNTPRLTFALWGDMPYDAAQAVKLPALIADITVAAP
jgi:hypothetical protein